MALFFEHAPATCLSTFLETYWTHFERDLNTYRKTKLGLRNICLGEPFREAHRLRPPKRVLDELRQALADFDSLPLEPPSDDPGGDYMSPTQMKQHVAAFYQRLSSSA
jgi:hypothetical protein